MSSARLLGREHEDIGALAAIGEGRVAIALCRGGARKVYAHTDPNEDAVCFAVGPGGALLAVADGHDGARGAERVIETVLERAPLWIGEKPAAPDAGSWEKLAFRFLQTAHDEVHAQAGELRLGAAPTTLSLALVRPDQGLIVHASVGDSHVFVAPSGALHCEAQEGSEAQEVGWASTGRRRTFFLGGGHPTQLERDKALVGTAPLAGAGALVLASDGLSERGIGVEDPPATVTQALGHASGSEPDRRALEACRGVAETAMEAQRRNSSGDNVAVAVLWLAS